jgi:integrase
VLRHTCATLALLDGVDLLTVSRRLRHKTITITATFYGHVKAEHTTQMAESFDRLMAGVR